MFSPLDAQRFEACFIAWMQQLCPSLAGQLICPNGYGEDRKLNSAGRQDMCHSRPFSQMVGCETCHLSCEIKGLHAPQLSLETEVAAAPAAYQNAQLRVATTHAPRAPLVTAWATTAVHSLPVRRYSQA